MTLFLQQFLNGIANGSVYATVGLALVLIYRTTGLLNFAQGEMALFATYVTWKFTDLGVPVVLAILMSAALAFVGGAIIERGLIRPVNKSSPLVIVIVTLGMFQAFNALAQLFFGVQQKTLPRAYAIKNWDVGGVFIRSDTVAIAGVLAAECLLLWLLLQKTKLGLGLRAVASNPESSRLVGINSGVMLMFGWGLAAALGALAGALVVPTTTALTASSMQSILVYSFAGAALGGFDSPLGAVVGGLIVGVAEALTIQYVDALHDITLVVPFVLIGVVLLFRPTGLFGRRVVERV